MSLQIKMSTMIVQRRPEGLAEGECRYRSSEYEEGRLNGAAMRSEAAPAAEQK